MYVAKYSSNGNLLWAKGGTSNNAYSNYASDITADIYGNSYFLMHSTGHTIVIDTAHVYESTPDCIMCDRNPPHAILAKFNAEGNIQWAKTIDNGALSLTTDPSGSIYYTNGTGFTKLNSNGTITRTISLSPDGFENYATPHLITDQSANLYWASSFMYSLAIGGVKLKSNGGESFVAKYDSSGKMIWVTNSGNPTDDYASGIAVDNNGNAYTAGIITSSSNTAFGKTPVITHGETDVYAARIVLVDTSEAPNQISLITGNTNPCLGTKQIYFVPADTGITYVWGVDKGAIISTYNNNAITVSWNSVGQNTITYFPQNSHGTGQGNSLVVTVSDAASCLAAASSCDTITKKSSIPTGNLNQVLFVNSNTGFLIGDGIYKTNDGGITWKNIPANANTQHRDIVFTDANTGYIGCNNGVILKTTDQGETWQQLTTGMEGEGVVFASLSFINNNIGWASVLPYAMVAKTTDGGQTWQYASIIKDSASTWNQSVAFMDADTGLALLYPSGVYRTIDGGATWNQVSAPSGEFVDIAFTPQNNVIIGGSSGQVLQSTDAGKTWKAVVPLNTTSGYYSYITFVSADTGYVAGTNILKTTDGGTTWLQMPFVNGAVSGLSFINSTTAFATGDINNGTGFLYKTTDGTNTWNTVMHTPGYFTSASFPDNNLGYVTNDDMIWKTSNGGKTWQPIVLGSQTLYVSSLTDIYIKSSDTLVATGASLYTSYDGGQSWNGVTYTGTTPINTVLSAITFTNSSNGYVVGENGSYLRSTDGGKSWTVLNLGTTLTLSAIKFVSPSIGFIAGGQGLIMKTTNGGNTWNTLQTGVTNQLNALYFTNDTTGYAVGTTGMMIRTTDGGTTWQQLDFITAANLNNIKFMDSNIGYAVGGNFMTSSVILKTTDGGNSWTADTTNYRADFTSINITSENNAYILANSGTFVKVDVCIDTNTDTSSTTSIWTATTPEQTIKVYPNPNGGKFIVKLVSYNNAQIAIYNTMGQQIQSIQGGPSTNIDLGTAPAGVYYVSIISGNEKTTEKIIVE